jgi:hypothetical protein
VRAVLWTHEGDLHASHSPLRLASIAAAAAVFSSSLAARADALPPDGCTQAGVACSNAGPMYDEPGICTAEMCPHMNPDGGVTMVSCDICEPTDAGVTDAGKTDGASSSGSSSGGSSGSSSGASSGSSSGGSSGSGSGGSSGSGSGGSGSSSGGSGGGAGGNSGGGGGCTLTPLARDGTAGLAMLALGIGALTLARRRRDP